MSLGQPLKGEGQYDLEYAKCCCFWGRNPGKFVLNVSKYLNGGNVLDLGAGECKNGIYLAEKGFEVDAVEVSKLALRNFELIANELDASIRNRIHIFNDNVLFFVNSVQYDLVIAYGLLHCLSSIEEVNLMISKMKGFTKPSGIIIAVSFTDTIKIPEIQSYLEPTLLPVEYLLKSFSEFEVLEYDEGLITESHPTTEIEHHHSLTRLMVKKA